MRSEPASVVYLDDSGDLRELMPVLVQSWLGVNCLSLAHLMDLEQHSEEVLGAKVALLDINLGPNEPDGVEAFHWLMAHGFQGRVLFFTGHARTNPRVALAEKSGAEVLEKPLEPNKLMSKIEHALNVGT